MNKFLNRRWVSLTNVWIFLYGKYLPLLTLPYKIYRMNICFKKFSLVFRARINDRIFRLLRKPICFQCYWRKEVRVAFGHTFPIFSRHYTDSSSWSTCPPLSVLTRQWPRITKCRRCVPKHFFPKKCPPDAASVSLTRALLVCNYNFFSWGCNSAAGLFHEGIYPAP